MIKRLHRNLCAVVCLAALTAGSAGAVSFIEIEDDQRSAVLYADEAGLLPDSISSKQSSEQKITKQQLCASAVRVYASVKNTDYSRLAEKAGERLDGCPYTDTKDNDIRLAWLLGLTQTDSGKFNPDGEVSVQLMDTMLYRALNQAGCNIRLSQNQIAEQIAGCRDKKKIAKWARPAEAYFLLEGLREKDEKDRIGAQKSVTYQDLASMAYKAAEAGQNTANQSSAESIESLSTHSGQDRVSWTNCNADSYRIYYYSKNDYSQEPLYIDIASSAQSGNIETVIPSDIQKKKGTYYWSVDAFDYDGRLLGSTDSMTKLKIENPVSFSWTPQTVGGTIVKSGAVKAAYSSGNGYAGESYQSKCNRVFGGEAYHMYASQSEALSHQTSITVPVWRLKSDGSKYASTASFSVNSGVASTVKQIFQEIYESDEKFPIKDVGGYNWRGDNSSSEHCLGLAIDINWNENYMCSNDGTPQTGSYWKPGVDAYSIPADGSVVQIFAKYGFVWGGTWNSKKDYMHFSYFGT